MLQGLSSVKHMSNGRESWDENLVPVLKLFTVIAHTNSRINKHWCVNPLRLSACESN